MKIRRKCTEKNNLSNFYNTVLPTVINVDIINWKKC